MRVGLFIPCYVDQFYPNVAKATLELLEKFGIEVVYPLSQTCCGQPMANSGYERYGKESVELFLKNFREFDYIVAPSGSCTLHVKEHVLPKEDGAPKIYELCEFLTDVLKVENISASFPHKVGFHSSCHGLRGLRLGKCSERMDPEFNKPLSLLSKVKDIQMVELDRKDECCGFGGTFAIAEEAVSVAMGKDRIADHKRNGVEVITGADMSCLMHLEGLLKREKSPIKIKHIAEVLIGSPIE
ncbi:(Fe-S)-binding protein [Echinicola jeungdonensis]|uniref:(Fe-S)-binding protein n=1 Tax=Echinicola jeungdonensis TaxID=709343 RepID=A0ABV5JA56_9BACT|nr:(Fe-S)-binding protein [Echinicola jeungdonensis]MDN3669413.1 (Fe-S)-binding protein [Echinicola jeungdonensis]